MKSKGFICLFHVRLSEQALSRENLNRVYLQWKKVKTKFYNLKELGIGEVQGQKMCHWRTK